jgi:FHA domain
VTSVVASASVETTLLALKIAFLVLLYLFIWRIVRSATKDVRMPQESMILAPQEARAAGLPVVARRDPGRLVVVESPTLERDSVWELDSTALFVGRGGTNDIQLEGDDYASTRHARIEPRTDGVWLEDVGSTNGTYVNGIKLTQPRKLVKGDVVRIGATDLRYDR